MECQSLYFSPTRRSYTPGPQTCFRNIQFQRQIWREGCGGKRGGRLHPETHQNRSVQARLSPDPATFPFTLASDRLETRYETAQQTTSVYSVWRKQTDRPTDYQKAVE